MEDSKAWWKSKSVIASLVVVAIAILSMLGKKEEATVISEQSEGIADWIVQLATLVAGAVAFYGRIFAKKVLTP